MEVDSTDLLRMDSVTVLARIRGSIVFPGTAGSFLALTSLRLGFPTGGIPITITDTLTRLG